MDVPQNETPEVVTSFFDHAFGFISSYGWHFLFFLVIANLLWSHLRPKWNKWQEKVRQKEQAAEYHKNPELLIAMQENLARSRQRLQEKHDRLARDHAEKLKLKEEQKIQEKIKKWECVQDGTSASTSRNANETVPQQPRPNKKEQSLGRAPNYNPLMGPGSGAGYRPSRRGGNSGGG